MIGALLLLMQVGTGVASPVELEGGARSPAYARDGRLAIDRHTRLTVRVGVRSRHTQRIIGPLFGVERTN